jgi:hypothetical protein
LGAKLTPRPSWEGDLVSSQLHLISSSTSKVVNGYNMVKARGEADQCRAGGLLSVSLGLSRLP